MRRSVLGMVLVLLAGSVAPAQVPHDVGAPASDIEAGLVRLPDPALSPERSSISTTK